MVVRKAQAGGTKLIISLRVGIIATGKRQALGLFQVVL